MWWQLQSTGFKAGHAAKYVPDSPAHEWRNLSVAAARHGGFASPFGSVDEFEDAAEYVGYLLFPTPNTTGICPVFDGKAAVDLDIATPYAKLVLLLAVGAIRQSDFDRCVQATKLATKQGIDFSSAIQFTNNLKAGWAVDHGMPYFDVLGEGPNSYRILLQVTLEAKTSSPLGLHRLDGIWLGNVGSSGLSGAFLANDNDNLARASAQGMVLISKVGDEGTEGAVFGGVINSV